MSSNEMTEDERRMFGVKQSLHNWTDQIGVYNESCNCPVCLTQIKKHMNEILDSYIEYQQQRSDEAEKRFNQP